MQVYVGPVTSAAQAQVVLPLVHSQGGVDGLGGGDCGEGGEGGKEGGSGGRGEGGGGGGGRGEGGGWLGEGGGGGEPGLQQKWYSSVDHPTAQEPKSPL